MSAAIVQFVHQRAHRATCIWNTTNPNNQLTQTESSSVATESFITVKTSSVMIFMMIYYRGDFDLISFPIDENITDN